MKKLLFILFLIPLVSQSQIRTRYHFPDPVIIIDTIPEEEPEEPGRPPDTLSLSYFDLPVMAPASYSNQNGIIIENKRIKNLNMLVNGGKDLHFNNCDNIIIRNCFIESSYDVGIDLLSCENVTIENCLFTNNLGGVYALNSTNINVINNQFVNPHGARNCRGQAVQFNNVFLGSIVNNVGEAFRAEAYPEDWISLYKSSGTSGSPLLVSDNTFRGGGPSPTGGGIMSGDSGGDWQLIQNNKLMDAGSYMFAIAGGNNNTVQNNKGYQVSKPWANIGCYVYKNPDAPTCSGHTMTLNKIWIFNANVYYGGNLTTESCGTVTGVEPNVGLCPSNPNWCFENTNEVDLTLLELDIPTVLITRLTEDQLWRLRDDAPLFDSLEGSCTGNKPSQILRPTAIAGADQSISISTATLSGSHDGPPSGGSVTHEWAQVSGPNTATQSAPGSATNNLSGLITGVYVFRDVVRYVGGAADADHITVTVTL